MTRSKKARGGDSLSHQVKSPSQVTKSSQLDTVLKKTNYSKWSKTKLIKEIKLQKRKKYGLIWDEKSAKEIFEKKIHHKLPILKEHTKKEIKNESDKPMNILIEGDNYHGLSVLNYTHKGKIDIIYIDPPYNLGGETAAFRYNDKYVLEQDGYKHSKWLSFMNNRLRLASKLLKKNGLILISINDVEVSQLKLLCDDIFLESNFITKLIWKTRENVDGRSLTGVSVDHEYILVYRKSEKGKFRGKNIDRKKFSNPDNDRRGPWMSSPIDGIATKDRRPNLHYVITNQKTGLKYKPNPANGWRYSKTTLQKLIKEKSIIWPKNPESNPRVKRYLKELKSMYTGYSSMLKTVTYSSGTRELREIMNKEAFKFPKPSKLIQNLLEQSENKNSIILDFFAGSGTTGHAVLELNKNDSGNRQFILCTNNENGICTDVCYPRIEKIINGYDIADKNKRRKPKKIKGLGGNLKYYQTDFVDDEPTDKNKKLLVDRSTQMLCLKENCFSQIKKSKNYAVFKNHKIHLAIIYDDSGITPVKKLIKKLRRKFNIYVFSSDSSAREEEFEEVNDYVDLKPIPHEILNVYRRIFN